MESIGGMQCGNLACGGSLQDVELGEESERRRYVSRQVVLSQVPVWMARTDDNARVGIRHGGGVQ